MLARDRPRLPLVLGGCCSVSEGICAGVLGGSAFIFWLALPFLRLFVGVSDANDAID